jgi:hypothetical protein
MISNVFSRICFDAQTRAPTSLPLAYSSLDYSNLIQVKRLLQGIKLLRDLRQRTPANQEIKTDT